MRIRSAIFLAIVVAWISPARADATAGSSVASPSDADNRLKALYDGEWAWRAKEFGDPDDDLTSRADYLPRVDAAAQKRRQEYWTKTLAALNEIPVAQLSAGEKINEGVFRAVLEAFVAQQKYRDYEAPFASGNSFWASIAPRGGLGNAAEYRAFLGRMRDIPRYFDEQTVNMRAGLKRGFTPPRVSIQGRDTSITPFAVAVEKNPFYQPFLQMPPSVSPAQAEALRAEARTVISESVIPAYTKLLPFVRDEYIPKSRTTLAAEVLPNGKEYYQARIREFTTLDMTPEKIHAIGLQEVARIDGDMQATMKKSGWTGDFPAFLKFLKTDPQFYAKTPYELIARSTYIANRVNGQLKYTIGHLPRYRFTILPTPATVAPFATGGNGGLESCVMNTYNLPARPFYTLAALTAHECSPGHAFQAALALEGTNRPELRKNTYFSGYGEGWGLYTEWLGIRMGLYETPYDEFGRETYEMWRAARLVVDTGIHHMGWTRQQAIDFLAGHTALSDYEVTSEVDRYISWPGQALAYKLGEMTIRRKRAEAEAKLGATFDQRWFHDVILGLGAVPLPVLERAIDEWVAAGGHDPYAGSAQ